MSKKIKLIYSLGAITSASLPLVAYSARLEGEEGTNNQNNPGAGTSNPGSTPSTNPQGSQPNSAPKTIDPQFDTFKNKANKQIADAIEKSIDVLIGYFKDEIAKLKLDEKMEYKKNLSRQIYLHILQDFFEKNKTAISQDPDKFGFYVTFPYALARERKYARGDVEFNGTKYDNVIFGQGSDKMTKYDRVIDAKDIKKTGEEDNFVENSHFDKTIAKYVKSLGEQIKSIVLDEKDFLLIDDKENGFSLNHKRIADGDKQVSGFSVSNPKNYKSWDEYIVSKTTARFVEFDLKQNQEFVPEEVQPNQPKTPPTIQPIIPGKPPIGQPPETVIEALPTLSPLVRAEYAGDSTIEDLNNLAQANTQDVFFFNNPVNTRYLYKVESVESGRAKVSIAEKSKPNLKRVYTIGFDIESQRNVAWQKVLYEQFQGINETVLKFYKALGLDENLEYQTLANTNLINTVFGMVDQFIKTIYSQNYVIYQANSTKFWANKYKNNSSKKVLAQARNDSAQTFLTAVSTSTFNDLPTWSAVALVYDTFIDEYKADVFRFNKDIILANIKAMNDSFGKELKNNTKYSAQTIDKFVDTIQKDVYKLKALSSHETLNMASWFDKYVSALEGVSKQFQILRTLADAKPVTADNFKQYDNDYQSAVKENKKQSQKVRSFQSNFGIAMVVIGALVLTLFIALIILNFKTIKQRKLRTLYAVFLAIGLVFVIAGITLLLL
ncbi:MSC_0620 family F1-like ATPase-associated subunit [Mycoplasma simbae]|uniref:MSC_0620 family F1-like ATPase-associated subunit n=1 Tax=Mycoplasma simbae TaxID=36744 RepID=UPI0004979C51|nr:hypothetical protein [Mycoplasma simbae]